MNSSTNLEQEKNFNPRLLWVLHPKSEKQDFSQKSKSNYLKPFQSLKQV